MTTILPHQTSDWYEDLYNYNKSLPHPFSLSLSPSLSLYFSPSSHFLTHSVLTLLKFHMCCTTAQITPHLWGGSFIITLLLLIFHSLCTGQIFDCASFSQDRGIYLKPLSASVHSKAVDITEQPNAYSGLWRPWWSRLKWVLFPWRFGTQHWEKKPSRAHAANFSLYLKASWFASALERFLHKPKNRSPCCCWQGSARPRSSASPPKFTSQKSWCDSLAWQKQDTGAPSGRGTVISQAGDCDQVHLWCCWHIAPSP